MVYSKGEVIKTEPALHLSKIASSLGEYFILDTYCSLNGNILYVLQSQYDRNSIWRDPCWMARKELATLFPTLTPDEILYIITEANKQVLGPNTSTQDVLRTFFIQSQQIIKETASNFYFDRIEYDSRSSRLGATGYSHVKFFAWVYAQESKLLQRLSEENAKLVVLDIGTGYGHFIFTAHDLLNKNRANGLINYIGTDKRWKDMAFAKRYAQSLKIGAVFGKVDLDDLRWKRNSLVLMAGQKPDVIVANHVLEHLPKNPEEYLLSWGAFAKEAVIVSVPLEGNLETTISNHYHAFTLAQLESLAERVVASGKGSLLVDTSLLSSGIITILPECSRLISIKDKAAFHFGADVVGRIEEIYNSIWGKDAIRKKGSPIFGKTIYANQILSMLNEIYQVDDIGQKVARRLAMSIQYSYGTTDLNGYMSPISPQLLREVAQAWRLKLQEAEERFTKEKGNNLREFVDLWAEYNLYLEFRRRGQVITGKNDVDAFDGMSRATKNTNIKSKARVAFQQYEKADFIAFGIINELMRIQPEDIRKLLENKELIKLVKLFTLAKLFGEGRFYKMVQIYLTCTSINFREDFIRLANLYFSCLEESFHKAKEPQGIDVAALSQATQAFAKSGTFIPPRFDYRAKELKDRQRELAIAEKHLEVIENIYATQENIEIDSTYAPERYYKDAMLEFFSEMRAGRKTHSKLIEDLLKQFRFKLIIARRCADLKYGNDFLYWQGFGEHPIQMRMRSQDKRFKLYAVEAYAERMYLAAELAKQEADQKGTCLSLELYLEVFNNSRACIFLQEWIQYYSSRRPVIFGYQPLDSLKKNEFITQIDAKIHQLIQIARKSNADSNLWGWLHMGVTDRLRSIVSVLDPESELVCMIELLLSQGKIKETENLIFSSNPHDSKKICEGNNTPFVTVTVHVCNAAIGTLNETLAHAMQLDWPAERKWMVLGTSSTIPHIAQAERDLCLELGVTRYSIDARRHLKAGNQNRTIPNSPKGGTGESFYLTLDDDYCIASQAINRMVPLLVDKGQAGFLQIPLYFRANDEPWHSLARKLDATLTYFYMAVLAPALHGKNGVSDGEQDSTFTLPFGTNTLYRITKGKNYLEDTGYFPVGRGAEDTLQGYFSYLKRYTTIFEPSKMKYTSGVFMNETWIIGDSVDFLGKLKQQIRWSEGGTYAFIIWLKFLIENKVTSLLPKLAVSKESHPPPFSKKQVILGTAFSAHYPLQVLFSSLLFIAFPLSLLFYDVHPTLIEQVYVYVPSFVSLFCNIYIAHYIGITFSDLLGIGLLHSFACYPTQLIGVRRALFDPSTSWEADKASDASTPIIVNVFYFLLALLNIGASIYGLLNARQFAVINLFVGLGFCWLFRVQKSSPNNQPERILSMFRELKRARITPYRGIYKGIPHAKAAGILFLMLTVLGFLFLINFLLSLFAHLTLFLILSGIIFFLFYLNIMVSLYILSESVTSISNLHERS